MLTFFGPFRVYTRSPGYAVPFVGRPDDVMIVEKELLLQIFKIVLKVLAGSGSISVKTRRKSTFDETFSKATRINSNK